MKAGVCLYPSGIDEVNLKLTETLIQVRTLWAPYMASWLHSCRNAMGKKGKRLGELCGCCKTVVRHTADEDQAILAEQR